MKKKILLFALSALSLVATGCDKKETCNHFDNDSNHLCDLCGEKISEHKDDDSNHLCDLCGEKISEHKDDDSNHFCDVCNTELSQHIDENNDYSCDICGEDLTPTPIKNKKVFDELVSNIKTNHNYTMEIISEVEGWDEEDNYYDCFANYNNLAIESKDFEYGLDGVGKIYQKDQGFVSYYRSGTNISPIEFVSTNPQLKISDFNDVIAENLFYGSYVQDEEDSSKFVTTDINSIAVACNLSGFASYIEWGMFHSDTSMSAFVDIEKNEITIKMNYWLMYFDIVEHNDKALLTLVIKDIGKTTNKAIESYIENPTHSFVAPTEFSEADKNVLLEKFSYKTPVFPTGISYSYSLDVDTYDGYYYSILTDKNSGNLTASYGAQLIADGFTLTGTDSYSKVTYGEVELQKITHKVFMKYFEANEVYPNGVMQIYFRSIDDVNIFYSIDEFNNYLTVKKYDELVPTLPAEETCTKISNVKDTTYNDTATYALKMNSTDTFRIYIESYEKAKAFALTYAASLMGKGFTNKSKAFSMTNYGYASSKSTSYVAIDIATEKVQYPGYLGIRYVIYKVDEESLRPVQDID